MTLNEKIRKRHNVSHPSFFPFFILLCLLINVAHITFFCFYLLSFSSVILLLYA